MTAGRPCASWGQRCGRQVAEVRPHPGVLLERAPIASHEARVAPGLARHFLGDGDEDGVRIVLADDQSRLPALAGHVDAHLQRAPAPMVEDELGGNDQARAVEQRHPPWIPTVGARIHR